MHMHQVVSDWQNWCRNLSERKHWGRL